MGKRKPKIDVPTRFSQFQAQTQISNEALTRIEQAAGGHIRIDAEGRAAIQRALQEFEYLRTYESAGINEPRRADLRNLAAVLEQAVTLARQLNVPPLLWPYIAELANVDYEIELVELQRLAVAARATSDRVELARKDIRPDPWLPRLLLQLEEQYVRAGGNKTGVTNKRNSKTGRFEKGGRFVRFCNEALLTLPESCRLKKSVGSRWAEIYATRRKRRNQPQEGAITTVSGDWPGKATGMQLKT
jgi:hypothetical protein